MAGEREREREREFGGANKGDDLGLSHTKPEGNRTLCGIGSLFTDHRKVLKNSSISQNNIILE